MRTNDPDALRLHPLLGDLADRVVVRVPCLESGRRLEEHSGKEESEDSPSCCGKAREHRSPPGEGEKIPAAPDEMAMLRFLDAGISFGHKDRLPHMLTRLITRGSLCGQDPPSAARSRCSARVAREQTQRGSTKEVKPLLHAELSRPSFLVAGLTSEGFSILWCFLAFPGLASAAFASAGLPAAAGLASSARAEKETRANAARVAAIVRIMGVLLGFRAGCSSWRRLFVWNSENRA